MFEIIYDNADYSPDDMGSYSEEERKHMDDESEMLEVDLDEELDDSDEEEIKAEKEESTEDSEETPEQVVMKDGKNTMPYSFYADERTARKAATKRADDAEKELQELKDSAKTSPGEKKSDQKIPEEFKDLEDMTDAELAEFRDGGDEDADLVVKFKAYRRKADIKEVLDAEKSDQAAATAEDEAAAGQVTIREFMDAHPYLETDEVLRAQFAAAYGLYQANTTTEECLAKALEAIKPLVAAKGISLAEDEEAPEEESDDMKAAKKAVEKATKRSTKSIGQVGSSRQQSGAVKSIDKLVGAELERAIMELPNEDYGYYCEHGKLP